HRELRGCTEKTTLRAKTLKTLLCMKPPCEFRMLQQQQPNRDQRERVHHRMNLFAAADNQIKANMRNEAPGYSLGYRKGQGDEDYSQKCRKPRFNFPKIYLAHAFEHR